MKVQVLGAGCDVGKSCVVVSMGPYRIMFDCGVHQGLQNNDLFPDFDLLSDIQNLTAVIITHAHIDHCAAIPRLVGSYKYDGPIYMTIPTRCLLPSIIKDQLKLQQRRKNWQNIEDEDIATEGNDNENVQTKQKKDQFGPQWNEWLQKAISQTITFDLRREVRINEDLCFTSSYAGHVLGAVMVLLKYSNCNRQISSVVYTGDFNTDSDPLLRPAELVRWQPDVMIMESTNATILRQHRFKSNLAILDKIRATTLKGGKVLIPVASIGRAQEFELMLDQYWDTHQLNIPVFTTQGMRQEVAQIHQLCIKWTNSNFQNYFKNCMNKGGERGFRKISQWQSEYFDNDLPCVLFASPVSMVAGISKEAFVKWAGNPKNLIVASGSFISGSIIYQLQNLGNKHSNVWVDKKKCVQANCQIEICHFGNHADLKGLLQCAEIVDPKQIVLVHGESSKMPFLADQIFETVGIPCTMPENSQSVFFDFENRRLMILDQNGILIEASQMEVKEEKIDVKISSQAIKAVRSQFDQHDIDSLNELQLCPEIKEEFDELIKQGGPITKYEVEGYLIRKNILDKYENIDNSSCSDTKSITDGVQIISKKEVKKLGFNVREGCNVYLQTSDGFYSDGKYVWPSQVLQQIQGVFVANQKMGSIVKGYYLNYQDISIRFVQEVRNKVIFAWLAMEFDHDNQSEAQQILEFLQNWAQEFKVVV